MTIAEQIIWNTDSDGYLKVPVENIAYRLNVAPEKVEGVLYLIQQMDPPGIGSRDLRECLLSQLREMDVPDYVVKIVKYHFDDFANHRFEHILRQLHISREDLDKARKIIGRLNPKPASDDSSFDNYVVVPDLIVTEENGVFQVMVNDGSIPELKISSTYLELASRKKKVDKETRDYLKKKIDSARWFIQSIYQRRDTMIRVMKAIINRQKPFFEGRPEGLKPMILKDIAEDVGMDISTISRVTNGKYVQTPVGLYELKYFFSEGMKDVDGDDVSTRLIKQALKEIVDHEDKRNPLNDEKMVRALEERGFKIARRTVAKYREQMGIPVARLRREL
jgi:RNA polymerase sigma-54 factor